MLIVPYVMPGFDLAKEIYNRTRGIDWDQLDGMILLNHGVFTFDDDPKVSYEKMINIVSRAEDYLADQGAVEASGAEASPVNTLEMAKLRQQVGKVWNSPTLARIDDTPASIAFSNLPNIDKIANKGAIDTRSHYPNQAGTSDFIG